MKKISTFRSYLVLLLLGLLSKLDKDALTSKSFANIVRSILNLSIFKINSCLRTNLYKNRRMRINLFNPVNVEHLDEHILYEEILSCIATVARA